jgi:5-methylcytosine-specific restriction protein A
MAGRNPPWIKDELILALDLYFKVNPGHLSRQSPEVIELSDTLNRLPLQLDRSDTSRFRNPNGVYMKLCNFLRFDPDYRGSGLTHGGKLETQVWDEFYHDRDKLGNLAQGIRAITLDQRSSLRQEALVTDEDLEASEGRVLSRLHSIRERSQILVRKKKDLVMQRMGKLECEVCQFSYPDKYGPLGDGFMECHHLVPISQLRPAQTTKLSDLALVCADCHRMLHRGRGGMSLGGLRMMVQKHRRNL